MPLFRTLRRVCFLNLLAYAMLYLFARWSGFKPSANDSRALDPDTIALKLRNAVDKALDEAVSDTLLAGNVFHTSRSSRKDLKRILEIQETLSTAQRTRDQNLGPALQPVHVNDTSHFDAASSTYAKVCHLLFGKRILFVGPETTFFLHELWLESQELYEHSSDACFGRDYCTFHHICRAYPDLPSSSSSWSLSSPSSQGVVSFPIEMVGRKKKMPSKPALHASGSSVLQYAMSSTLHAARDARAAGYTRPLAMVDEGTGVRMPDTYWLGRAKKADVLVFGRAPVPAPAGTYHGMEASGGLGNWTFADTLCDGSDLLDVDGGCSDLATRLTNAALHTTLYTFLPSVLAFLKVSIASANAESVLLWHGSWYIEPLCASRGVPRTRKIALLHDIWSDSSRHYGGSDQESSPGDKSSFGQKTQTLTDPWSFYYNAQVYMHEQILPKILPHFNITYISLAAPAASEKGLSNSASTPDAEQTHYSPLHPKNCIRAPWPGFGTSLEGVFKRSLLVALQHAT